MGMAMIGAIASAAIATTTGFMQAEQTRTQQLAQASQLDAQAKAGYQRARQARELSEIEARRLDRQKSAIRRQYESLMARNNVNLAAGNVDASSGSPLEIAEGNILNFADDMSENAYAVALKRWEGIENQKALHFQAEQYDAQSSYLEQTSGNLLTSLLSASMQGASAFFGAGGGQAIAAKQAPTYQTYDPALQQNITRKAGEYGPIH